MARLWARTTTFDSVNVGDELPILVKWETAETIARFAALLAPEPERPDQAPDPALEAPPTASSQALLSYVTELLEKGFPLPSITAQGSSLTLQVFAPVQAEDTISLAGRVVAKGQRNGLNLVECLISIENQDNRLVGEATAAISL